MMQNRYLTGEEKKPKTKEEWKEANGGMPLLTDLCLAMRSDPLGMIRGLEEVVTCIYGPAVTYAFPDPLVTAYRHSVAHVSLISVLDGTALNWCGQEKLMAHTDERHSALREGERSRTNGTQLPGAAAVQSGGKT